ncbi:MAG: DUF2794 domain-containing protein [Sphingomonadaceae bacterium]|nr:DUF2794 domain-containing protein [Sphingomonadaceae bacterium]
MTATVTPLHPAHARQRQTVFDRTELSRILDIYGRMVAAGQWRDYAITFGRDHAVFAAFRRASERPELQLWKRPELRAKGQLYALVGEHGQIVKRGSDLAAVLAPVARRLLKAVE